MITLKGKQKDFPLGPVFEICLMGGGWSPGLTYEGNSEEFTIEMNREDADRAIALFPDKLEVNDGKIFQGKCYSWTYELAQMVDALDVSQEEKHRLFEEHTGKGVRAFHSALEDGKKQ